VKLKLEFRQAFVIGGYRPGSNGIDALLVGDHNDSRLRFAGKVRAGFVAHVRREVFKALKARHADRSPFGDPELEIIALRLRRDGWWPKFDLSNGQPRAATRGISRLAL
jgi:ATP-dependent DNA ligase